MDVKTFVTRSGKANITCPECNKVRQMNVSRFRKMNKEIRLKCTCTCNHVFTIVLERRQHIRIEVDLKGNLNYNNQKIPVRVTDVSRVGMKIRCHQKLDIKLGEKLLVNFILDDITKSRITKEVIVKTINPFFVGTAFVSSDHYDKFGNYILFKNS